MSEINMNDKSMHALLVVLSTKQASSLAIEELRRNVQAPDHEAYKNWDYYDKLSVSIANVLMENNVITHSELDAEMHGNSTHVGHDHHAADAHVECSPDAHEHCQKEAKEHHPHHRKYISHLLRIFILL